VVSDHLGSPRLIVDIADGSIAQQIDYDSFGNILSDTNPNFQPFTFAGGLNDNDTALIRFGARDYDPTIGRWTSKDPIGLAAGTNVFIYVNNDPVNFVDLIGKNPIAIGIGAGIAIGRAATIIAPRLIALAKLANSALSNWLHNENVAPPEENPPAEGDKEGESEQPTDKPKEHSEGEKALNDLLNDLTNSGSKPLSPEDADAALDLGKELGLGTRDDRKEDHWKGGPHIHIDKCRVPKGGKHIPALPND